MALDLKQAQCDMRAAYRSGGAGVLASAIVWLGAAVVALRVSPQSAVWALLVGGMAIHPVATAICKLLGASGAHSPGNPLAPLAWAGVLWLVFSLPLAYVVSLHRVEWFFPAMLLVIGGRYLTFQTLFGLPVYWLLGSTLAAAGLGLGRAVAAPAAAAFVGGAVELLFAAAILGRDRRERGAAV